ncbi:MAG: hypothetical protein WDO17_21320 [Alphaproteobacteria bacterium]
MDTSIFLARLIGPLGLALGFGVLFNRAAVRAVTEELARNPALIFLLGVVSFPAGLAIVLTHNVWVADWPVLITIQGWLTTIAGAFRIVAPQDAIRFGRSVYAQPTGPLFSAVIWLMFGVILTFFGYFKGVLL